MFLKKEKGFTLIELMIVVAIIGILAAIAIPRFADLIRKSKEGATKGNLGALRSALSIYYGENEGLYPSSLAGLADRYIDAIPTVKLGIGGVSDTAGYTDTTNVTSQPAAGTTGKWGYWCNTIRTKAGIYVDYSGTDTKGEAIHGW